MTMIAVGLRNNKTVDVDMCSDGDEEWGFYNLSVEDAKFLREELSGIIARLGTAKTDEQADLSEKTNNCPNECPNCQYIERRKIEGKEP